MIKLKAGAYYTDATGVKRGPIRYNGVSNRWDYAGSIGLFSNCGVSSLGHDPSLVGEGFTTPQQFGDLTDADKGALLLAQHQGKVIQEFKKDVYWDDLDWFSPPLAKYGIYRVKPDRLTGTVEVVDGNPDFNTWKEIK